MDNTYDDLTSYGDYGDYDDSFYDGSDDLLALVPEEESPLSRLKGHVLSIDWEITDEGLLALSDELGSLKDYWAGEKINLVYVQALDKLTKYIYAQKARAHPSAVKLLLTLYQNLENIVSHEEWTDAERRSVLSEDIRRFEQLTQSIEGGLSGKVENKPKQEESGKPVPTATPTAVVSATEHASAETASVLTETQIEFGSADIVDDANILQELKAALLGLDWEYDEKYIDVLSSEVRSLKEQFKGNDSRQRILDGLDSIGGYLRREKAQAHASTFQVMHALFETLEKAVTTSMSKVDETALVLPVLDRYEELRQAMANKRVVVEPAEERDVEVSLAVEPEELVGDTTQDSVIESVAEKGSQVASTVAAGVVAGAAALGGSLADSVGGTEEEDVSDEQINNQVDSMFEGLNADSAPSTDAASFGGVDASVALQGVDVETEADDDSDEEALPLAGGAVAPAFAALDDEDVDTDEGIDTDGDVFDAVSGFFDEDDTDKGEDASTMASAATVVGVDAEEDDRNKPVSATEPSLALQGLDVDEDDDIDDSVSTVDSSIALQGVDVETEADDDSDEEPLPIDATGVAPALSAFGEDDEPTLSTSDEDGESVAGAVAGFFDDQSSVAMETEAEGSTYEGEESVSISGLDALIGKDSVPSAVDKTLALQGVDVETDDDDDSDEEALPTDDGGIAAPALAAFDDEDVPVAGVTEDFDGDVAGAVSGFFTEDEKEESEELSLATSFADPVTASLPEEGGETADDDGGSVTAVFGNDVVSVSDKDTEVEEESVSIEIDMDDGDDVFGTLDSDIALQGVDVETEADDDSDEEALPVDERGVAAPAFSGLDVEEEDDASMVDDVAEDVHDSVSGFFGGEENDGDIVLDESDGKSVEEDDAFAWLHDDKQESSDGDDDINITLDESEQAQDSDDGLGLGGLAAGALAGAAAGVLAGGDELKEKAGDVLSGFGGSATDEQNRFSEPDSSAVFVATDDGGELATAQNMSNSCDGFAAGDEFVFDGIADNYKKLEVMVAGRPLEETMLRVFYSVMSYCNLHRSSRDAKAAPLLSSTAKTLVGILKESDELEVQKMLLKETSQVLAWQASLMP